MLPSGSTIIGRIEKAHGLKGMLLAHLDSQIQTSCLPRNPAHCWIEMDGRWAPYGCLEFRLRIPHGLFIKLDNIHTPEQGRALFHAPIALENVRKTPQAGYVTDLKIRGLDPQSIEGASLTDIGSNLVGRIVRLHHRPPQDFLEFTVDGQPVYLPLVSEFIRHWNESTRVLECELPDGLLDLYLNPDGRDMPKGRDMPDGMQPDHRDQD
jgi:16S rRNA processing protein RimM